VKLFVPPEDARLWQPLRSADAGEYFVTFKSVTQLSEADRSQWAQLTRRAGADTIFAADWFMASALRHCASRLPVRLAIVRAHDGAWIGVLPITFEGFFGRCPLPGWHGWHCTNQFDGSPLIERGAEHLFWHCLLAELDRKPGAALALCCETLPVDAPATRALAEVCLAEGRPLHEARRFARPMRRPGAVAEGAAAARRKLDKRLDGLTRKLAREVGEPQVTILPREADPAAWTTQFLALEKSGWKGAGGSALASKPGTAGLFREVIRIAHQQGAVRLMSLEAGGTVIAMTCWLVGDRLAYGFKMAFAQSFASYAPGRLLMRAVADEAAAATPHLAFDTCARPDAPADPLWPDKREFADLAISIGSGSRRAVFASAVKASALWRSRFG
jgi:CelD/BcsL family acetyltransferase involved in cellulose biosynthesis